MPQSESPQSSNIPMEEHVTTFSIQGLSQADLTTLQQQLLQEKAKFIQASLRLDLTRGKPSSDQLNLSNAMDGILNGKYQTESGTDVRNYGGLDGLAEAKALVAPLMNVDADHVFIGGNSSLTMMYQNMQFYYQFGPSNGKAWKDIAQAKFLCPVPGYDRHFAICEEFGIEMIPVAMDDNGPIMDEVEALIKNDSSIVGMWCVPRFSNPSGIVYSDETVERIAKLASIANPSFRVFWDNAYSIHTLNNDAKALANIFDYCRQHGSEDSVIQFGSTSKITFAGAGLAWMTASKANLADFAKHLGVAAIGPDKVNQLRHIEFFTRHTSFAEHMQKHADLLKPRFDRVLTALDKHFANKEALNWTVPEGGYFVSVDTLDGLAKRVVALSEEMGVKLTPAGATFPYGKDPKDSNIRIAPSFPKLDEIEQAMDIFALAVKLATVEQAIG